MNIFEPALKIMWKNTEKADNKRLSSQIRPTGVEEICDISYIDDGEEGHLLDVYYPKKSKDEKLPVIIDIHGGGWVYGYKELNKNFCFELAKRGFCVISLSYRLAFDKNVLYGDQLFDLFSAFSFISKNISQYPADKNNIFLVGDSAGGNFACLSVALNKNESLRKEFSLPNSNINFKCVGAISPVIDLSSPNLIMNVNLTTLIGYPHKTSPLYKLMNFENIAKNDLPPFYIVTASGDFVEKQAIRLHNLLDCLGVENVFSDWKEKINGKKLGHVFSVTDPFLAPSITVIDKMTAFFKEHISK